LIYPDTVYIVYIVEKCFQCATIASPIVRDDCSLTTIHYNTMLLGRTMAFRIAFKTV